MLPKDGLIVVTPGGAYDNDLFTKLSKAFPRVKIMRCQTINGLNQYIEFFSPTNEKNLVAYIDLDKVGYADMQKCLADLWIRANKKDKRLTIYILFLLT
jgi:hypothetical protein